MQRNESKCGCAYQTVPTLCISVMIFCLSITVWKAAPLEEAMVTSGKPIQLGAELKNHCGGYSGSLCLNPTTSMRPPWSQAPWPDMLWDSCPMALLVFHPKHLLHSHSCWCFLSSPVSTSIFHVETFCLSLQLKCYYKNCSLMKMFILMRALGFGRFSFPYSLLAQCLKLQI